MKQSNTNSYEGQSWRWPQSTWLQRRLNAIKAQEEATRQKQPRSTEKPPALETKPPDDKASEER